MGKPKMYPLSRAWRFGGKSKKREAQAPPGTGPKLTRRCTRCGQLAPHLEATDTLAAHQWQSNGQWCKGGQPPTDDDLKLAAKAKKKRSVRTSSAGLPTLGKP